MRDKKRVSITIEITPFMTCFGNSSVIWYSIGLFHSAPMSLYILLLHQIGHTQTSSFSNLPTGKFWCCFSLWTSYNIKYSLCCIYMHKYTVMIQFDFPTDNTIISSKPVALSFSVKQLTGCWALGTHVAQHFFLFYHFAKDTYLYSKNWTKCWTKWRSSDNRIWQ